MSIEHRIQRTFPDAPEGTPVERIYDYPHYFDISYDYGYQNEIDFFDAMIRRATGGGPGRVLELAAGSGRIARPLAARGHRVTALDREASMLDALRRHAAAAGLRVDTVQQDMTSFDLHSPGLDAVYTTLGLVTTLWPRDVTLAHMECVERALRPGGLAIFPGPAATRLDAVIPHYAEWETNRGGVQTRTRFFYDQRPGEEPGVVDYTHEITVLDGGRYHVLVDASTLRVYTPEFVDFILANRPGLEFAGWYEFYDPAALIPSPDDRHGTATHIFRRR